MPVNTMQALTLGVVVTFGFISTHALIKGAIGIIFLLTHVPMKDTTGIKLLNNLN